MAQRKITTRNTKVWVDVDPQVLSVIDSERHRYGSCSRASILRMALAQWIERNVPAKTEGRVA